MTKQVVKLKYSRIGDLYYIAESGTPCWYPCGHICMRGWLNCGPCSIRSIMDSQRYKDYIEREFPDA